MHHVPLACPILVGLDFANLQRDVELVNASDAHWFHLDVMDGVFVPNISFGMPVMEAIARHAKKPLDVHLMIVIPTATSRLLPFGGRRAHGPCRGMHPFARTLGAIRQAGMKAGVALNRTPLWSPFGMWQSLIWCV